MSDFVLRETWVGEVGGKVILDQGEIHFRPRAEAF